MTSTKRAFIINTLKKSSDELFPGFFINLFIFLSREDEPEYISHDISDGVPEVIGLMLKQDNKAAEVCMEYFGDLLTELAQKLLSVFY